MGVSTSSGNLLDVDIFSGQLWGMSEHDSILYNPRRPELSDEALTHWPTPRPCTLALLDEHPPPTRTVVDPSAGSGAIVEPLLERGHDVVAYEIRPSCADALGLIACRHGDALFSYSICDWLKMADDDNAHLLPSVEFAIVGNPPYKPSSTMLLHVRQCLRLCGTYVALHLPLSFLSGGSERRRFWANVEKFALSADLSGLYWFDQRPKYEGPGGQFEPAWLVWDADWQAKGKKELQCLHLGRYS